MENPRLEPDASVATVQDMKGSGQVVVDCLRVPLILRTILQHLSTTHLLKLSLVNKLWCYEAGSLLRDRGSLTTTVRTVRICQDIRPLASKLKRMKETRRVIPITGIKISMGNWDWSHGDHCEESSSGEMNQAYEEVLNLITWKHLSVKILILWPEEFQNCPGFLLVKKILEKSGSALQEFSLGFNKDRHNFLQQSFESCCSSGLPRLKILNMELSEERYHDYTRLIKALVSLAPNLKVLHTSGWLDLNVSILDGSSAVHVMDYPFSVLRNEIPEAVVGKLQMTNLELYEISRDFQLGRFNRITSGLLQASRTTLSSLHIDALFLLPLTIYGICLENVRTLQVNLNHRKLEHLPTHVLRLLKSFDFKRIFPNLTSTQIHSISYLDYATDGINEMVEQGNAALPMPMPDRAVNIKTLDVTCLVAINDSAVRFLREMFPDIETLSIGGAPIPFCHLWESWRDLKELHCKHLPRDRSMFQNLDSVFCGIFPEEVAQLREEDEDYLARVNIVPVMPSLTCLQRLETLCFIFGPSPLEEGEADDPTYMFSKVAGEIAFGRCPARDISLLSHDRRYKEGEYSYCVTRKRPWKHMTIFDLVLRVFMPAGTIYLILGWPLVLIMEPNMPIQPINSRLLAPIKEYRILVILFGIIDLHALMFLCLNFAFLVLLLYFSCERVRMEGRAVSLGLRLRRLSRKLLRQSMTRARSIQLYILWVNRVSCWGVFAQKIVFRGDHNLRIYSDPFVLSKCDLRRLCLLHVFHLHLCLVCYVLLCQSCTQGDSTSSP